MFFFSSRRRHTRWPRDWSSDVCSSDLFGGHDAVRRPRQAEDVVRGPPVRVETGLALAGALGRDSVEPTQTLDVVRSEERRVGKEWGSRVWRDTCTKNKRREGVGDRNGK